MDKFEMLKKYFGYDSFREGQESVIDHILEGQDTIAIMPTGAGKSICYQIPGLLMEGIALVVSPLISLMKDQVGALNQAGVHAAYINSSLTPRQITLALQYAREERYKIIYVAPERLLSEEFLDFAMNARISMVTIDEAHCISQWGQDFRPGYLKIAEFLEKLPKRPVTSAFTATATSQVRDDIIHLLDMNDPYLITTGFDRPNLFFGVKHTKEPFSIVLQYVKKYHGSSGIIYCLTRKKTDEVWERLKQAGVQAARYHAGLSDGERQQNQEDFLYDRKPVMVATNAFGMGIDKSSIRYVLHYNMPKNLESYYQEAGRAGRDGDDAECILLFHGQDITINQFFIENDKENDELDAASLELVKQREREKLKQMVAYCHTKECLRNYILNYFGEKTEEDCQKCSNCHMDFQEVDITQISKWIMKCVKETGERFGLQMILVILAGSNSKRIQQYHLTKLSSYGALSGKNKTYLEQVANFLLEQGYLSSTNSQYPVLMLTLKSQEFLDSQELLEMKIAPDEEVAENRLEESVQLNTSGEELFEQLRNIRFQIASQQNIPPYLVFTDKTLREMCRLLPDDRGKMLLVSGVGEMKFQHYGQDFLNAILQFKKTSGSDTVKRNTSYITEITEEMKEDMIRPEECYISELVQKFNEVTGAGNSNSLISKAAVKNVTSWLVEQGYLEEVFEQESKRKLPTRKGIEAGITARQKLAKNHMEYLQVYYNEEAQRMVVEYLSR